MVPYIIWSMVPYTEHKIVQGSIYWVKRCNILLYSINLIWIYHFSIQWVLIYKTLYTFLFKPLFVYHYLVSHLYVDVFSCSLRRWAGAVWYTWSRPPWAGGPSCGRGWTRCPRPTARTTSRCSRPCSSGSSTPVSRSSERHARWGHMWLSSLLFSFSTNYYYYYNATIPSLLFFHFLFCFLIGCLFCLVIFGFACHSYWLWIPPFWILDVYFMLFYLLTGVCDCKSDQPGVLTDGSRWHADARSHHQGWCQVQQTHPNLPVCKSLSVS